MATYYISSGSVAAEMAGARMGMLAAEDQLYSLLAERPFMRPKYVSQKLNIPVLIVASLLFLLILMWFDLMRLSFEYAFLNVNKTHKQVLSYLTFCLTISVVLGTVIILILKFWLKKW